MTSSLRGTSSPDKASATQPHSTPALASLAVSTFPTIATPCLPLPESASPTDSHRANPKVDLITHTFDQDRVLPRFGQLVKIRLDQPLSGPGSSQISPSAPSSATLYNYHCAVVLYVRVDARLRCLMVSVFPIAAYTGARFLGTSPEAWVAHLPLDKRRELVPMPFIGGTGDWTIDTMPEGFGEPIRPLDVYGNRYGHGMPSWIVMDEHVVRLPWTTVWKSFNPDVRFTNPDVDRLQDYANHLQFLAQNTHDIRVNMLHIPEDYTHPKGVFEELFGDFQGVIHYLSEDGEAEREQIEAQGDEYPEVPGLLELFRMIGTGDEGLKSWMAEEEERIRGEKKTRVKEWLTATSQTIEWE